MKMRKSSSQLKKATVTASIATSIGLFLLSPLGTEAALGDRTLKPGTQHQDVKELQNFLKQKGYFTFHTSTGYYGDITKTAVERFQKAGNLPRTGIVDDKTLRAIVQQKETSRSGSSQAVLKIGSRGDLVSEVQTLLKEAKFFDYHTVTGFYGEITATGVRKFQSQASLQISGQADAKTIEALRDHVKKLTEQPMPTPTPTQVQVPTKQAESSFLLKVGTSSEAVRELQNQLKHLGYFKHNVTGYFGPITKASVKEFQKKNKLIVDGLVTTSTMKKLVEQATSNLLPTIILPSEMNSEFNAINLVADSSELLGTPYLWGGTTSTGMDCSGFIQNVFQKNTIQLPRTVAQMWSVGRSVSKPNVGDIVFFETYTQGPSHAGIYIGNNQFIHSGASTGVTISNLTTNYWSSRYLGSKRYH